MKKMLTVCSLALAVLFLFSSSGWCNTDSRNWTLATGEVFYAELVKYDITNNIAVLRINEKEEKTYKLEDFSAIDGAWLLEWSRVSADLAKLSKQMKGDFSHYQLQGKYTTDYYVYTPGKYKETKELPLLFLFHPGGKGARYVQSYMQTAEKLSIIIVSSDSFRNSHDDNEEAKMLEIFKELLTDVEKNVPCDKKQMYMGGSSGGAMRAYTYSAQVDHGWAGIYANGGWLGGSKYYDLPYRNGMRVAMQNGHNDHAANHWIKPDEKILAARGCIINLFAFEGGHQAPPADAQVEALKWLINGDEEQPKPVETPSL